jgi:thymidylate synthase (FAD)
LGYGVEVKLLAITPEAEKLTETAGRLCHASEDKLGTSEGWLQARIKAGEESLIEHASATFYIKASRALTHELVRHRIGSYSQRSQRYVKETEADYITPPELVSDQPGVIFHKVMEACWKGYRALLQAGVKPEIARYVLPNACTTQIICTWNFRELRHIIKQRTSPRALPEMRQVALKIREIMKAQAPEIFQDV